MDGKMRTIEWEKNSYFYLMVLQREKHISNIAVLLSHGSGCQKNIDNKIKFFYY